MELNSKIFVAGGRGLVGSALVRSLNSAGYRNVFAPTSKELNLVNQADTQQYLEKTKPNFIFVAAAKVGGIGANSTLPADFSYLNLMIQCNLIHGAYQIGVSKLLFLGSSCIYPKDSEVPIKESALLKGPLEPTNEAYALAKICGVKMCDYYRWQHGCDFISVMPTNTYGPNDNFDLQTSHMIPALIRKFYEAKLKNEKFISIWGTGKPRRELIHVDDLASAGLYLMKNYSEAGPINAGTGEDYSIQEIAEMIRDISGFSGELIYDPSKPDGVYRKVMDVSRLLKLGWKPKIQVKDGLASAYEWFKSNYNTALIHKK